MTTSTDNATRKEQKIVYIDMDDVLCDFAGAHRRAVQANPAIQYPQSQYGFFTQLEPIEYAIDAVNTLIASERYAPYILTAPSVMNPLCYTEKRIWVEQHLGMAFVSHLIICAHKGLLRGDILIDDNVRGRGQESFQGQLIQFGSGRFPDWRAIVKTLEL